MLNFSEKANEHYFTKCQTFPFTFYGYVEANQKTWLRLKVHLWLKTEKVNADLKHEALRERGSEPVSLHFTEIIFPGFEYQPFTLTSSVTSYEDVTLPGL